MTLTDRLWLIIATDKAADWSVRLFGPFETGQAAERERAKLIVEHPDWKFSKRPVHDPTTAAEVLS